MRVEGLQAAGKAKGPGGHHMGTPPPLVHQGVGDTSRDTNRPLLHVGSGKNLAESVKEGVRPTGKRGRLRSLTLDTWEKENAVSRRAAVAMRVPFVLIKKDRTSTL